MRPSIGLAPLPQVRASQKQIWNSSRTAVIESSGMSGLWLCAARLPRSLISFALTKIFAPTVFLKLGSWMSALRLSWYGSLSAESLL